MVFSSPPSWLPQSEFDEFNDITYDKIKSYTSIPKLKRLERYMREEGFAQTAEVARQRIIAHGGKDPHCPEPCLSSSEVEDVFQNIQFWQENIKGKDAELQKLLNSKSTTILDGACDDLSNRKTYSPEVRKMRPQVMELDSSSKEDKAKKLPKKDIRSGREYYEGWDKYVSHWEKENIIKEKLNKEATTKKLSKETFTDPIAQENKRNEARSEAKPLVEREWLANREREKGNDLFKAKEFNSSLQAYTKAISMYKDNAVLYANRAAVYLKMNRNEEAYADCTEALKLDPQNVKINKKMEGNRGSILHRCVRLQILLVLHSSPNCFDILCSFACLNTCCIKHDTQGRRLCVRNRVNEGQMHRELRGERLRSGDGNLGMQQRN